MIAFWIICGILILVALLFVLTPLLRREQNENTIERSRLNISLYQQQLSELETDHENALVSDMQYEEGKRELQKRLLEDVPDEDVTIVRSAAGKKTALLLGLAIPVLAVLLYLQLGHPKFLGPQEAP
ncbi:MAG TPA: c-type cytochrome biogenesis protein CcmI, partial [Burkholderiales bacterium]|nr:c-type cytochrome biogenesis protein CcmI [Burkholderiales bacterium]